MGKEEKKEKNRKSKKKISVPCIEKIVRKKEVDV